MDAVEQKAASEAARTLSTLGASKGGRARAEKLSPEERKEIAKTAAKRRWGGVAKAKATHVGELHLADRTINCANLEDGRRVLTQETFLHAIGRARKAKAGTGSTQMVDGLPPFLAAANLNQFIDEDLRRSTEPILYRTPKGGRAFGYEARLLPLVCNVYLKARDKGELTKQQEHIAVACDILIRGLAEVGINALVDEATGYQYDRARRAMAEILEQFIAKELVKWAKMFPDDFYRELFRLKNCPIGMHLSTKRPRWVGRTTVNLIYRRLAPGVLTELQKLTPRDEKGRLKHKLFMRLTEDIGHPKLREHFVKLITLMKAADDWPTFKKLVNRALPVQPQKEEDLPLFANADDDRLD
ncbi:MAG: P63C domain-containing protein [Patescibacteria group bacterium]|nr:P63C domain-containing protein [Patescibacteria group bacterium]